MNNYEVLIHGRDFNLKGHFGKVKKVGFYTHRYLNGCSVEEAKEIAQKLINKEAKRDFINNASNPGEIIIEEVVELESFDDTNAPGSGYTFYPMEPNFFQRVINKIFKNKNN